MPYPQAPWNLQGYARISVHLTNIDQVRQLIPKELEILAVWPGKTLGGVYLSYYGHGSVLEYNELIVIPAFVGYNGIIGGWVSHIYVDNPDSVGGGREIWGLPKEIAEFTWEEGERVTVHQGNRMLCSMYYKRQTLAWRQWLSGSSFSAKNSDLLSFIYEMESRLGFIGSNLEVPTESPLFEIGLDQPLITVSAEKMSLRVRAPEVVGHKSIANSEEKLPIF
jgi:hypothetical protein